MDEADFTGEPGHIMKVDRTIKRAPMARVEMDTPFYVGTIEALCLKDETDILAHTFGSDASGRRN